jgi:hypothetical protein
MMATVFNKVDAPPPAAARDLNEDIHKEILLRLPAESVLRCQAVCRAWRRIATYPRFVAAHQCRRPAQPVVYTYLDESPCSNHPAAADIALDVVPFVSDESAVRQRLIRYPKFEAAGPDEDGPPAEEPEPMVRQQRRGGLTMHCLMLSSCSRRARACTSAATPSQKLIDLALPWQ